MVRRIVSRVLHPGNVPWLVLVVCSSALVTTGLLDAGPAGARQEREVNARQPNVGTSTFVTDHLRHIDSSQEASTFIPEIGPPPRVCGAPNHGLTDGPSRNGWTENNIDKAKINQEENDYRGEPGPESARIKASLKVGGEYLRGSGGPNADLATLPTFSGPEKAVDGGARAQDNASKVTLDRVCFKSSDDKRRLVGGVVAELQGGLLKTLGTAVCVYPFPKSPRICFLISSIVGNAVAGIIQRLNAGAPSQATWGRHLGKALDVALAGYPGIHRYAESNIGLWMGRVGIYLKDVASKFQWFKWAGISSLAVRAGNSIIATGHAARKYMISPQAPPTKKRVTARPNPKPTHHKKAAPGTKLHRRHHRHVNHGGTSGTGHLNASAA